MKRRRISERFGFLKTDKGKLRWVNPRTEGSLAGLSADSRKRVERLVQAADEGRQEDIRKGIREIIRTKRDAAIGLCVMAEKDDISELIPKFPIALRQEEDPEIIGYLCQALVHAAKRGTDISLTVPALTELLEKAGDPEGYGSGLETAVMRAREALELAIKGADDAKEALASVPITVLFDDTAKKGDKVRITPLCEVEYDFESTGTIFVKMNHLSSGGTQNGTYHRLESDDWPGGIGNEIVTDEGSLISLRNREGRIEAKIGSQVEGQLPDFGVSGGQVQEGENTLYEFLEGGALDSIGTVNLENGYHVRYLKDDIGFARACATISIEAGEHPYGRIFSLEPGEVKSFTIGQIRFDVESVDEGIRITKSRIGASVSETAIPTAENEGQMDPVTFNAVKAIKEEAQNNDVTGHLGFLLRALDHEDSGIINTALDALWLGASHGTDISSALPKLIDIVDNPERHWCHTSASWCLGKISRTMDLSYLVSKYTEAVAKDDVLSYTACHILTDFVIEGTDISSAFPVLAKALRVERLESIASAAFKNAAERGTDISGYVPELIETIKRPSEKTYFAYFALDNAGRMGADIREAVPYLIAALGADTNLDGVMVSALHEAAKQGADVDAAVPQLERIAADEDSFYQDDARKLLDYLQEAQT